MTTTTTMPQQHRTADRTERRTAARSEGRQERAGGRPRRAGRPAPLPPGARDLMADAGRTLGRAIGAQQPDERFAAAHLAALRGAAAVLAARARPRRAARHSAWDLLPRVAPELADWAVYFAAGSAKRQAVDAGVPARIPAREADDMVRQAAEFLDLVDRALGEADR